MKKLFAVRPHAQDVDLILLVIRIVMGFAFILHGVGKIQSPMSWMGPNSPVPGIFQALGAIAEFGGGIALLVGLVTCLASLGLMFTMLVAAGMHAFVMGDPFVSKGGGSYELPVIYLLISVLFMVMGPGRYALDKKIFGSK
jgi:putative oxidoreductase